MCATRLDFRSECTKPNVRAENARREGVRAQMKPRDRLWAELIFPWCEPCALLSLRAVCRAFLAQLSASRLWLALTMQLSWMRYDERLLGWPGVERAMQRERNTCTNCEAGHSVRGPMLDLPGTHVEYVGGRFVAPHERNVVLFDVDTGAQVASFDVEPDWRGIFDAVVLDRWIAFAAADGRLLLLDCVAVRLVDLSPADPTRGGGVSVQRGWLVCILSVQTTFTGHGRVCERRARWRHDCAGGDARAAGRLGYAVLAV